MEVTAEQLWYEHPSQELQQCPPVPGWASASWGCPFAMDMLGKCLTLLPHSSPSLGTPQGTARAVRMWHGFALPLPGMDTHGM